MIKEKNFYAVTSLDKCTGLINDQIVGNPNKTNAGDLFFKYPNVNLKNSDNNGINMSSYMLAIYPTLKHINKEINRLYVITRKYYELMFINNNTIDEELNTEIIHLKSNLIKRFLDDLISITYCCLKNEIKLIDLGYLIGDLSTKDKTAEKIKENQDAQNAIRNLVNYEKFQYFFQAINDIHNSFKHSILNYETSNILPSDKNCIILVSYYQNNKGTEKLLYSYFKQIIQGFNDFLEVSWSLKKPTDVNHKY
ncbi:MAG: hypothetical protein ACI8TE_000713 [Francisella sp.]|jgi:hypothetical protein